MENLSSDDKHEKKRKEKDVDHHTFPRWFLPDERVVDASRGKFSNPYENSHLPPPPLQTSPSPQTPSPNFPAPSPLKTQSPFSSSRPSRRFLPLKPASMSRLLRGEMGEFGLWVGNRHRRGENAVKKGKGGVGGVGKEGKGRGDFQGG